jgi:hypothetical protein
VLKERVNRLDNQPTDQCTQRKRYDPRQHQLADNTPPNRRYASHGCNWWGAIRTRHFAVTRFRSRGSQLATSQAALEKLMSLPRTWLIQVAASQRSSSVGGSIRIRP